MNSSFSTDFIKIIIFSLLVTIFFSLAGWQAGAVYYNLTTEKKEPPPPLYIFPISKVKPQAAKKKIVIEKKSAGSKTVKKPAMINSAIIKLTYPKTESSNNLTLDKQNPLLYSIQTGIFKNKANADKHFQYFLNQGYSPVIVMLDYKHQLKIYAVRIGKFKNRSTAMTAFKNFKKKEKKSAVLTTLYNTDDMVKICKNSLK